jgi:hypothetical protein
MKNFNELSEREVLALAISLEEEDERVYADLFEGLRQDYSGSAALFNSSQAFERVKECWRPMSRGMVARKLIVLRP